MSAAQQFAEFRASDTQYAVEALTALFDQLPAVEADFMLGDWRGGVFICGHPGEGQLGKLRWVGKRFVGMNEVYPILVGTADGEVKASDVMGRASLREVVYKGQATATMVYDTHPTFDYFHKVDTNTVMGVMDSKSDAQPLFFYLNRMD